jgi:phenylacetate-coenzyme A ligase PaaK-like adenylate-forming protein
LHPAFISAQMTAAQSSATRPTASPSPEVSAAARAARDRLDGHVYETVQWHFHPSTGCPFWLDMASRLKFDPLKEVKSYDDLKKFPPFEDEWLRGGPVRRWVPKVYSDKPIYVFETGGTTGIPKSRVAIEDFRIDYSLFSESLPDEFFPKGSNWLMLGPSGPRRLRLAIEHLAQHRGGICFCIDLDPRWVIKLIKRGWMEHLEAYKQHCIDQAITILSAGHDVRCMFTTPKLLEALALELEKRGSSIRKSGITGIFSGGTEFTPQWTRFATEEFLDGVYMTPTYGNTLMGLAASKPVTAEDGYKITYYAPQPRAVIEVVDFKDGDRIVGYGETGRVKLTTLTKEFFVPGFLERDEGEREPPYEKYPWDGVSGVRPFHELAEATTVGVY